VNTAHKTGSGELDGGVTPDRLQLLERDAELAAVQTLIGSAAGRGRLLAIEGPPGIGKSALILEARIRGHLAGMQVLGARGSPLEAAFSFGIVRQLFEPFLADLSDRDRAELLSGAAELANPLFEPAQLVAQPTEDVSLAMLHGLYWLTANAAARRPLLLVIDDLQWCDPPSLRLLAYLLPRLDGLDLSIVVGLRSAEPGQDPALLAQIASDPVTTVIRPAPLSEAAAAKLVGETLSPEADEAFCQAFHDLTGGNPLLVHELLDAIRAEEVAPVVDNVSQLQELAARAGWRAVSVRLSRLPPEATRLAQAVAILGEDVDPHHAAVLAELSDERAMDTVGDLIRVDILRQELPLGFVHPLIREAVYETLTPIERSSGHARASRLLAEAEAEPERVAAQLLHAPPGLVPKTPGLEVVAVMRDAARRARGRGASESAVAYLRRAVAEPAPEGERAEALLELGHAETLVSGDTAVEHLRESYESIEDPRLRAKTAYLLGFQLFFLHRVDESVGVFTRAIRELGRADAELERLLEAGLLSNATFEPALYREAVNRLRRIGDWPSADSAGEKMLLALLAFNDARADAPASVAVQLARHALAAGTLLAKDNCGVPFVCAGMVLALADSEDVLPLYESALGEAHRRGSIFAFAGAKVFRAQAYVLRGALADAEVDAREARDACEAWGIVRSRLGDCAAFLADALMEQGRLDEAEVALARSGWSEETSMSAHLHFLLDSRARLRLLRGDLPGGIEAMREARHRFEAVGGRNPAFMPSRGEAALALADLGEEDEARRLAAEDLEHARTWGAPRALGAALRVAGLIQGGDEGIALLQEAVEVLADSPAKLEHAKARADLGAALRRGNHRAAAREHLRRAVELATICGAAPLAARAETELLATGARPRRIALSGVESLTPSERRVAELAAEGPTNREIAQALFVTSKTVEVHLSSVYRKLGISSRSQLSAALAEPVGA
jgi:DNA-binding CsgD family transcriptional regulator